MLLCPLLAHVVRSPEGYTPAASAPNILQKLLVIPKSINAQISTIAVPNSGWETAIDTSAPAAKFA